MAEINSVFVFYFMIFVAASRKSHAINDYEENDVRFSTPIGQKDSRGPIEVLRQDKWSSICRNNEDYGREAVVICRQMGYVGGWPQHYTQYVKPSLAKIVCKTGDEPSITSCDVTDPIECIGNITIGVWCYNDTGARLIGYDAPNAGRVQVQFSNKWMDVCFFGTQYDRTWESRNLQVLCRHLGYPGLMLTMNVTSMSSSGVDAIDDFKCLGDEPLLQNCLPDLPTTGCSGNQYVFSSCAGPGYIGCFLEPTQGDYLLPDYPVGGDGVSRWTHHNMTIQSCIVSCIELPGNMQYAGLRGGNECYCGKEEREQEFSIYKKDDTKCNMRCAGNHNEICGGSSSWLSIYDVRIGFCNDPGFPENGRRALNDIPERRMFAFGSLVTYECFLGFILVGSPTIQCVIGHYSNQSVWNASIPVCMEIPSTTTNVLTTTQEEAIDLVAPRSNNAPGSRLLIGATVGGCVVLLLVVVMIFLIFRKQQKKGKTTQAENPDSSNLNGKSNCYGLVPDETKPVQLSTLMRNSERSAAGNEHAHEQVPDMYEYAEVNCDTDIPSNMPEYDVVNKEPDDSTNIQAYDVVNPDDNPDVTTNIPAYDVVNDEETYCDINLPSEADNLPEYDIINPNPSTSGQLESTSGALAKRTASFPSYALVNKKKYTDQTDAYTYADIGDIPPQINGEIPGSTGNEIGGNQVGWADNALYAEAGAGCDEKGKEGIAVEENEENGWAENSIYDI
ncbi:uncharacterized protein [Amphiura filiformis]|uniref:uncharacterized protein n=1 Tax=Amphiura filiformis TaxID=82378 RepID=UPI003B210BE4